MNILVLLILIIAGCATPHANGITKPTSFTDPAAYVENFPLDAIGKDLLMRNLGLPTRIQDIDGKTYLGYELGDGYNKQEYVFIISEGVVVDVQYYAAESPYNGISASLKQAIQFRNP